MLERFQNIVYDLNYTAVIPGGGFVVVESQTFSHFPNSVSAPSLAPTSLQTGNSTSSPEASKPQSWLDRLMENLGLMPSKKAPTNPKEPKPELGKENSHPAQAKPDLAQQVKALLQLSDAEYDEKKLTSELRQYIKEVDNHYNSLLSDYKSHIAPSYWEFGMQQFNVSGILGKSYYTQEYPSYIDMLWTRDIMAMHAKWDMSFYLYPEDDSAIQSMLKQKATQLKAELSDAMQKGITIDKEVEQQYRDVEMIREKLTTKEERYFEF